MTTLALRTISSSSLFDVLTFRTLAAFSQRTAVRFAKRRAASLERRRIAMELSTYTDRELADMGFSRADIPAIVNGTYQR